MKKKHKKPGRPSKDIDPGTIFRIAQTMLSVESIARILGCCKDTIYANKAFSDALYSGREHRRQSLVEAMWDLALKEKDGRMMIFLSKQHLGYKDSTNDREETHQFNITINEIPT